MTTWCVCSSGATKKQQNITNDSRMKVTARCFSIRVRATTLFTLCKSQTDDRLHLYTHRTQRTIVYKYVKRQQRQAADNCTDPSLAVASLHQRRKETSFWGKSFRFFIFLGFSHSVAYKEDMTKLRPRTNILNTILRVKPFSI